MFKKYFKSLWKSNAYRLNPTHKPPIFNLFLEAHSTPKSLQANLTFKHILFGLYYVSKTFEPTLKMGRFYQKKNLLTTRNTWKPWAFTLPWWGCARTKGWLTAAPHRVGEQCPLWPRGWPGLFASRHYTWVTVATCCHSYYFVISPTPIL